MRASAPTGKTRDFTCSLGRTYVLVFVGMPKAVGSIVRADALVRPPAQAATTARAARSEAERAEKEADQIQFCTPTQGAPAPRESTAKSLRRPAAPVVQSSQPRRHHLTPPPRQRGGPLHRSASKRLSLWTVHGPFLFWQDKREMGGASPLDKPPAGAESPLAAVRRPLRTRRRVRSPSHRHG